MGPEGDGLMVELPGGADVGSVVVSATPVAGRYIRETCKLGKT